MHRLIFLVTMTAALAACGDDETGGAGGSGGAGSTTTGSAGGGDDAATTTGAGGDGGGDGVTTATTGGGGGDFQSLIDACEDLDTALNGAATDANLACTIDSNCEGVPGQFPGCEAEVEALVVCQTDSFDPEACACNGDGLDCDIFSICQTEQGAFTACREAQ